MDSKFRSRTSWRAKLDKPAKLVAIPPKMTARFGHGTMLIPRPLDVDALIRKVAKGRLVTVAQLRERLAKDCGADVTCPLTTGIFIRIAAEAAEEDRRQGGERITPYWRVVREDGGLYEKFPGGVAAQARRLREEGHRIAGEGRRPALRVQDFEARLARL